MKITVSTVSDYVFELDVAEDLELENFKAFCEVESGFPSNEIVISFKGRPLLDNKKTLKDCGISEGDVVELQHVMQAAAAAAAASSGGGGQGPSALSGLDFSSIRVPQPGILGGIAGPQATPGATISAGMNDDPATVRDAFLSNPDQLALLKQNNPVLAEALASGSLDTFATVLRQQINARYEKMQLRRRMMEANPFDHEAQKLIAEEIRQKNIEANMEAAMEHNPEAFGTVVMLYINCRVNGVPVKAFVDSGAQATIMSAACAERCNVMRLVDSRWAGVAKGVGVQKIIGRVHVAQVQIEEVFLTSSFSVLEDQSMDMLLGLDMLKRHLCKIDLQKNVLHIGTTGTETPFLPENELPTHCRLSYAGQDDDEAAQAAMKKTMEELEADEIRKAIENSKQASASVLASSGASPSTSSSIPMRSSFAASAASTDNFSETDIQEIQKLGFNRDKIIVELRNANGNKTQAIAALFAKSFKF